MERREHLESSSPELSGDDGEPPESPYQVLIANQQSALPLDEPKLINAVRSVFEESQLQSASISLALVDDPTMHELNREYLDHDYPTDVLSFVLECDGTHVVGQLIASVDTAVENAGQYGWTPTEELLLYVVHGSLHLVGYDDRQPEEREAMREAESAHLHKLGIEVPASHHAVAEERA